MKTLFCFVVLFSFACAERAKSNLATRDAQAESRDAQAGSWYAQAGVLAAGTNAFYSWRFYEEGRAHYTVGLHAETQKQACASYSPPLDRESDYWYMSLYFGNAVAGTYQVGEVGSSNELGRALEVSLLHRYQGRFLEHYKAVAGEVTIAAAPTFVDARAEARLILTGWLAWPAVPRTTVVCSGWYPEDGGIAAGQTSCRCKDSVGVESTCETELFKDCCVKATGDELLRLEIKATNAKPCAGMCNFLAGLPDYCSQVLVDPVRDASIETVLDATTCNSTCERNTWPQVAVRFASDQIKKSDVLFVVPNVGRFSGDSQSSCPMLPPESPAELSCSAGIILGAGDTEVSVRIAPSGLTASEVKVTVAPKNHCAVDIAYITAKVVNGTVVISEPEYRSPCAELGLSSG